MQNNSKDFSVGQTWLVTVEGKLMVIQILEAGFVDPAPDAEPPDPLATKHQGVIAKVLTVDGQAAGEDPKLARKFFSPTMLKDAEIVTPS